MTQDGCFVDVDELPVRPGLRVLMGRDSQDDFGDGEVSDREEFIRCYLKSQSALLDQIPCAEPGWDFFVENFEESAFNTHDFEGYQGRGPFGRYHYRVRKVLERVEDLAILHSCLLSESGRRNTRRRYEVLVEVEFRDKVLMLAGMYKRARTLERRYEIKRRIAELNKRIIECAILWQRHSSD